MILVECSSHVLALSRRCREERHHCKQEALCLWVSYIARDLCLPAVQVGIGHEQCTIPTDTELLVYSDAVPLDNVERARAREMNIPQVSYFEALGEVSASMRTIAVSGTHGKTTTTGMLATILKVAGKEPTAIVGSIVRDFSNSLPDSRIGGSNFLSGKSNIFVVEACEYKEHLLELSQEILVITNIELDHTDFL